MFWQSPCSRKVQIVHVLSAGSGQAATIWEQYRRKRIDFKANLEGCGFWAIPIQDNFPGLRLGG